MNELHICPGSRAVLTLACLFPLVLAACASQPHSDAAFDTARDTQRPTTDIAWPDAPADALDASDVSVDLAAEGRDTNDAGRLDTLDEPPYTCVELERVFDCSPCPSGPFGSCRSNELCDKASACPGDSGGFRRWQCLCEFSQWECVLLRECGQGASVDARVDDGAGLDAADAAINDARDDLAATEPPPDGPVSDDVADADVATDDTGLDAPDDTDAPTVCMDDAPMCRAPDDADTLPDAMGDSD